MASLTNISNTSALTTLEARGYDVLAKNAECDKTGLFYKVYTIGKGNLTPHEADGVYFLFGTDSDTIRNIAYNDTTVLEEYKKQEHNSASVFPKCTVIKFDNKISSFSDFIDIRGRVELSKLLFYKSGTPLPDEYPVSDFLQLFKVYKQWQIAEDPILKNQIENQIKHFTNIIVSGEGQEEYEKKHGIAAVGDERVFKTLVKKSDERLKPSFYKSDKEQCIPPEKMFRHAGEIISVNVNEKYLPAIEHDLQMFPNLRYSIVSESVPAYEDDGSITHWHMLAFSSAYETEVCAIVHKHEFELEDKTKSYCIGDLETAYTIPLASADMSQFIPKFEKLNLDYYIDMTGTYQPSDPLTVGIVVEDIDTYKKMLSVVRIMLDSKMNGTIISEQDKKTYEFLKSATRDEINLYNNYGGFVLPHENDKLLGEPSVDR